MPKRTSPNQVQHITDLNELAKIVHDKRKAKRSNAKKERRNRHYTKMLINQQVKLGCKNTGNDSEASEIE